MDTVILQHTKRLQNTGGMGAIIRRLPGVISFREPDGLGIADGHTIRHLRRAYAQRVATLPAPVYSLYHNGWGADLVADLDPARHRVMLLHTDLPDLAGFVRHVAPWVDAIFTVNAGLTAQIPGATTVPVPIAPPAWLQPTPKSEPVIGYCGRLTIRQKRVDRLPILWRQIKDRLPGATLEILGSGPDGNRLRQAFGNDGRVRFHGWLVGDEYWQTLARWQQIVFTSDWEGTPLAMWEAVAAGAVPIYPDFYPGLSNPGLLYPPGDLTMAVDRICTVAHWSTPDWERFLRQSREQLQLYCGTGYETALHKALASLPTPRSRRAPPGWLAQQCPVWIYNRLWGRRTGGA